MSNKSILFADDSVTMRNIMEKTFDAEPFDVVTVPSGDSAIAKAREMRPDIIIADAAMPGMSGYDVCDTVRNDSNLVSTPVLVLAGVSSPFDESKGNSVGVSDQMKKPFDTTQLIEKVKKLIEEAPAKAASAPIAAPAPAPAPAASAPRPMTMRSAPAAPPAPPPPPQMQRPPISPEKPAFSPSIPKVSTKHTMEFGRPLPLETPKAKSPAIELDEPGQETSSAFKVSTLAELAQMNETGAPVKQEFREDAIEMSAKEEPTPLELLSEPPTPVAIEEKAADAAQEVASNIEGLSSEQADAIRKLTKEVVERVVWEVVPDLAEAIIKEEISKLLQE